MSLEHDPRRQVRLVLFDVDGVLTDGTLYLDGEGEAYKPFNAKDGVAVALLSANGIRSGIVSGKASAALDYRAKQLSFDIVHTGSKNKMGALSAILAETGLLAEQVCFVGDDVMDLKVMQSVGVAYAPHDAHTLVLEAADHVTQAKGGQGVAREVAENILLAHGKSLREMYDFMLEKKRKTCFEIVQ